MGKAHHGNSSAGLCLNVSKEQAHSDKTSPPLKGKQDVAIDNASGCFTTAACSSPSHLLGSGEALQEASGAVLRAVPFGTGGSGQRDPAHGKQEAAAPTLQQAAAKQPLPPAPFPPSRTKHFSWRPGCPCSSLHRLLLPLLCVCRESPAAVHGSAFCPIADTGTWRGTVGKQDSITQAQHRICRQNYLP